MRHHYELFSGPWGEFWRKVNTYILFSCWNEWKIIACILFFFVLILTFIRFVISKQQSLGDIVFAIAGFRSYLPVQLCVGVIEGVDMVLRRLVYCDTAILIYVSGNYIERVEKCLWRRWKIYLCTRWVGNAKKGVKFERQHACAFRIWTITLVSNNRARMDYQYFLQACFWFMVVLSGRQLLGTCINSEVWAILF